MLYGLLKALNSLMAEGWLKMNDLIKLRDLLNCMMAKYSTDDDYRMIIDMEWPFIQSLDEMLYDINNAVCKE